MKTKLYSFPMLMTMLFMGLSLQACDLNANAIKGNENVIPVEKSLEHFDALHVSGIFKVFLVEGDTPQIRIETDENLHEYVIAEVKNNSLHLGMEKGNNYDPTKLVAYVTVNRLNELSISGAASITSEHALSSENMIISLSGASNLELLLETGNLKTTVSGAGNIELSGNANKHEVQISGVASMDCLELLTHETIINISGAASAKVHADTKIDASVSGVGSIRYAGNPESVKTSTSGPGSIKPV